MVKITGGLATEIDTHLVMVCYDTTYQGTMYV